MLNQDKQIGGESVHIRDGYVWAEIYYLDSPTNYREYLPQEPGNPVTVPGDELVMLEPSGKWPNPNSFVYLAMPLALLLASGVFMYFVLRW
jgi:hypothetical protein